MDENIVSLWYKTLADKWRYTFFRLLVKCSCSKATSSTTDVTTGAGTAYPFNPIFNGICVAESYCIVFCRSLLFWCPFPFSHCIVGHFFNYGFWLPHWYYQTFLVTLAICHFLYHMECSSIFKLHIALSSPVCCTFSLFFLVNINCCCSWY